MADAFRRFRVARKLRESSVITSFHLVPETGEIWPYRPGQYLTLRIPGPQGPVLRTYSLSMADGDPGFHRISVKREDKGIGSGWLHDSVARATDYWRALLGGIMLALVLLFPQGISGFAQYWQALIAPKKGVIA